MASPTKNNPCPDDRLGAMTTQSEERQKLRALDALLREYPSDARLHFLKGSWLAGAQDYTAARDCMRRAVDLAPDYGIARFQLGLLILTSGEPHAALESWGPLFALPADHFLKLFATGLGQLIRDDFGGAIQSLEDGIARNDENPAMNRDMQLIVDEIRAKAQAASGSNAAMSPVDQLLQQAALKSTRH